MPEPPGGQLPEPCQTGHRVHGGPHSLHKDWCPGKLSVCLSLVLSTLSVIVVERFSLQKCSFQVNFGGDVYLKFWARFPQVASSRPPQANSK